MVNQYIKFFNSCSYVNIFDSTYTAD